MSARAFATLMCCALLWLPHPVAQAVAVDDSSTPVKATPVKATRPPKPEDVYSQGVDAFNREDYAAARIHWSQVVGSQRRDADNNLGYLLYYGMGGERDMAQGVELWRRAAEAAQPESQMHLGAAYAEGVVLPKSSIEAYAWYYCAIATSSLAEPDRRDLYDSIRRQASGALEKVARRMSDAEQAQGRAMGTGYAQAYGGPNARPLEPVDPSVMRASPRPPSDAVAR